MNKKKRQIALKLFFVILCMLIVFPFWLLVSASFSSSESLALNGYQLWPKPFDLSAYQYVFKNPTSILRAYGVTFIFSIISMWGKQ